MLRIGSRAGYRVQGTGGAREKELSFLNPEPRTPNPEESGFTLIELLIAVVVIAVGMVFVLGALSQCVAVLTTSTKTVEANYLLNQKLWMIDEAYYTTGSVEGETSENFSDPDESFSWALKDSVITADLGLETAFVQDKLNEESFRVAWNQGKMSKYIEVVRFVKKLE